jgi:DNA helicase-2/ATP-dependent DNA helicase PcrA
MMDLPTEIADEERLLETVRSNLARLEAKETRPDHGKTLLELRDSLADERLNEDMASVVEAMERAAALRAQQAQSVEGRVDLDDPYFGHLVVDDDLGTRSVLIGRETFLSDRVRIVDWRNAPISRIFYQYAESDEYDVNIAGRPVSGEVKVRRTLAIAQGELRRVATDDHTWVRDQDGGWIDWREREAKLAGGAGAALRASSLGTGASGARRDRHLPEIASLLDPEQFSLITRPESGVVVIQGSAGSGKTTVGLHRIAYLHYQAPGRFRANRILVMVYSKALSAYIEQVLPALGVAGVHVAQYDRWAGDLRRRHCPNLPDAYADNTPGIVTRFKTSTAMLRLVDAYGRRTRSRDVTQTFEELLTDRESLLGAAARWAPDEFSEGQMKQVIRWCLDQHHLRSDGLGRSGEEDPVLDREDDSILLRLHQLVRGPLKAKRKQPLSYAHIMVDEAQDMSPLELAVLMDTANRDRSVTLAGDVAQTVAKDRDITDWTDVLDALSLEHVEVSPLQVSYRSTGPIMKCAHDILGELAPAVIPETTRDGAPVGHLRFTSMGQGVAWLAQALGDLVRREPSAYVALLTLDLEDAISWYQALERAEVPHIELIADQDFSFSPGIEVTDIRSSKGLEFDYVILLAVDSDRFGPDDANRTLLHVGATRAAHQLWIVSTSCPSPLIPAGLPGLEGA